ncbi:hypothetical protein [Culicoidibacter larvae]|uniref:Uncharacterized protein n=1 Tax=Culicoidibacter larvae TaxID=2579976 RepID=A0A5R8Q6R2_9FIRM|nr:hypothetical protein [Culicoidibacter larvae]TLG71076.1 hypothetical protein FEZ08_11735 [Culicoidibacter larvae]
MKLVNLTGHLIQIIDDNGNIVRYIEPSGTVCRIKDKFQLSEPLESSVLRLQLTKTVVKHLPHPREGTIYIVSQLVLRALQGSRPDVYAPYGGIFEGNNKVGCSGLYNMTNTLTSELAGDVE